MEGRGHSGPGEEAEEDEGNICIDVTDKGCQSSSRSRRASTREAVAAVQPGDWSSSGVKRYHVGMASPKIEYIQKD